MFLATVFTVYSFVLVLLFSKGDITFITNNIQCIMIILNLLELDKLFSSKNIL
jgi:hypothetical protein